MPTYKDDSADIRLSIVIVTYQSKTLIERCLGPLLRVPRKDWEIIVWDNASPDGTAGFVRLHYPNVIVFASTENLGFASGNNRAFAHCRGEFVLLLNPDAFIDSCDTLDYLAQELRRNPQIAAVGPQLRNVDGSHQVGDCGWRASLLSIAGHALFWHRMWHRVPAIYLSNTALLKRHRVSVDWICGACMMVRRSVIVLTGGMSDKIFMYGEDVDWGERIRAHGFQMLYLPRMRVLHLQGATQRSEDQLFFSTKWLDSLALRFQRKASRAEFCLMKLILFIGFAIRASILTTIGILYGQKSMRTRAQNMRRYAQYAVHLPYFRSNPNS